MRARRLLAVLLWSVIAGAFIGPGTVVTATTAGLEHGTALLWAVVFSTVTCYLLQEATARLSAATGHDLAATLRNRAGSSPGANVLLVLVVAAVVAGCAAYEAGNILGAVLGASGLLAVPGWTATVSIGGVAGGLLWLGRPATVARALGVIVAMMGLAFTVTAIGLAPELGPLLHGTLVPTLPIGSTVLVVALVGTTVVPYNLFLGSSLAVGQDESDTRFGLAMAIGLGGAVTAAIVVVGSAVGGSFSVDSVAEVLARRLGPWAGSLFAVGLCAAGLSSAITAPLAAALTVRGAGHPERWPVDGWRFRSVWASVLLTGVVFGLAEVRPVPAIVLAQALNGVMLPVVAIVVLLAVNDRGTVGASRLPGPAHLLLLSLAVAVTVVLGTSSVVRAGAMMLGLAAPSVGSMISVATLLVVAAAWPTARAVRAGRHPHG